MLMSGPLMYMGPKDAILQRGELYNVKIIRKNVGGESWPTIYVYRLGAKVEGGYWLKMVQYVSESEMERSWEEIASDGFHDAGVLSRNRSVPVVSGSGDIPGPGIGGDDGAGGSDGQARQEGLVEKVRAQVPREALYLSLAEECSELSQACMKLWRAETGKNPTPMDAKTAWRHVKEEFTDVILCSEVLGVKADRQVREQKLARWAERLDAKARKDILKEEGRN